MSNSKISALTSATTPLAGTETLPVVQSGATKQVSVANLTAGRAVSASSITLTTALAATSGGTGSTSAFVANAIPYASSTTALATSSNLTYNGTNLVVANGAIAIGSAAAGVSLRINKNVTGGTFSYAAYIDGQIQSDVTSEYASIQSSPSTQAAAFTLNRLRHYYANPGSFGAGSVVNNQYGFAVENSLTGATNNFGFHSNIAAATGRWNFYANGTAPNYFAGNLGIGTTSTTPYTVRVSKGITGSTFAGGVISDAAVLSDVTARADMFLSVPSTQAAAFTLARAIAYKAQLGTIGAGSAITNAAAFEVDANWTSATNNYGFYGNIASGTGRYNLYMAGTAANYFGGNTTISVTDNTNAALRITQLGTGNALLVEDSSNPDATPFVINASGQVVAGNTASVNSPNYNGTQISATMQVQSAVAYDGASLQNYVAGSGSAGLTFAHSRSGTLGTQTVLNNGDRMGAVVFSGSDGTAFIQGAQISSEVDGTPGTNDMPGRLVFSTTADGASSPTERLRIDAAGNILNRSIGGLGYGTGSGGAVTQLTSRTTGVTLNKTNGAITMFTAAGSATAATFTVTNSTVAATDTIVLNQKSGTNLYIFLVTAVAAGSFNITFLTTGGIASDAPVINFAVLKAVTA